MRIGLRDWVKIGLKFWLWVLMEVWLMGCLLVCDGVGVGDAEDLCRGEADGLGVGWAGWLLGGDVFEGAECGRASEGVGGGASCLLDGLESCGRVLECGRLDDGFELVEGELVACAYIDGGEAPIDEVEEEVWRELRA